MKCLWAKDQVDEGRSFPYFRPFLTGDATSNANNDIGILLLQSFPTPQLMEHFFLCFLANGAGI